MLKNGFLEFIKSQKLFSKTEKTLLTVSGGMDSMVMLDLFANCNMVFGVAHCNFNLRGTESDRDSQFVRDYAHNNGIQYFEKSFETKEFAAKNKCSIQEAARFLRYHWFEELCKDEGFHYYATAHHFDDQIETFFINLFRGTGVSGLRGILPKNGKCIRPLLFATRGDVEEYASKHNVPFREDSSNASDNYLRNRIRHHILPALASVKPDYKNGFNKTLQLLSGTEEFIDGEIGKLKKHLFRNEDDHILIAIEKLKKLPQIEFYLFELLKPYGFSEDTLRKIPTAFNKTPGKVFFSKTHQLLIDRDNIIISKIEAFSPESFWIEPGQIEIDSPIKLVFENITTNKNFVIDPDKNFAHLDFEKLEFPLQLRKWEKGDYFHPLGMKGRKKVSDYFIDQKYSLIDKQKAWLLVSGNSIVWIVGQRIDGRYKIDHQTKIIYRISLK